MIQAVNIPMIGHAVIMFLRLHFGSTGSTNLMAKMYPMIIPHMIDVHCNHMSDGCKMHYYCAYGCNIAASIRMNRCYSSTATHREREMNFLRSFFTPSYRPTFETEEFARGMGDGRRLTNMVNNNPQDTTGRWIVIPGFDYPQSDPYNRGLQEILSRTRLILVGPKMIRNQKCYLIRNDYYEQDLMTIFNQ